MKVLVTGAAGFIGKHLTKALLADGHTVSAIDLTFDGFNLGGEKHVCDITNAKGLLGLSDALKGFDVCVHLAAVASPPIVARDPVRGWSVNVQGTYNVLSLLKAAGIRRMLFFSSAHVYGISPKYRPTPESHPLALHDNYTVTKIAGEELCKLFYENAGISYTILRLFNAYGPGQSPDYFIGNKVTQARTGKMTMRNGETTKDWIHISDVVSAALLAMKTEYVGPLNIGTGVETDLNQIAGCVAEMFGATIALEPDDAMPSRMCCDNARARTTLGWEPKVEFMQGLHDFLADELHPRS